MRFERFETPGDVELDLSLASADLDVTTWDQDATEVEVEGRRADDATAAALEGFSIERHDRSGRHVVVVREQRGRVLGFRLRDPQLLVRVRCPEGAVLTVRGGSSDVRVDGRLGDVEAKTGSGDVLLGRVGSAHVTSASGDVKIDVSGGRVAVTTASGDALVGSAEGEVSVRTASGDVDVRDARAGASVQSASGDVRLGSVGGGDVRVQTVSGDAEVALTAGTAVWIDATSVSGEVTSDLDVGDLPPTGEDGPVREVRVRSVSGDVSIVRARTSARPA